MLVIMVHQHCTMTWKSIWIYTRWCTCPRAKHLSAFVLFKATSTPCFTFLTLQIGNSSLKLPYLPHNNLGWPYLSSRWDRNKPGSMHGSRTGIKTVHIVLEYIYSAAVASLQRLISPSPPPPFSPAQALCGNNRYTINRERGQDAERLM